MPEVEKPGRREHEGAAPQLGERHDFRGQPAAGELDGVDRITGLEDEHPRHPRQ